MSAAIFEVLLDRTGSRSRLPEGLRDAYGGDLWFPEPPDDRPYVFTNFVASLDGMAAFGEGERAEGRQISLHSRDDHWLMGLLRGAADAALVGAGTMREDPRHTWTARALKNADAEAVEEWRLSEGRPKHPLQCFVTSTGIFPDEPAAFAGGDLHAVVFATGKSAENARQWDPDRVRWVATGDGGSVDLPRMLRFMRHDLGVRHLLCEGGPKLYGQMLEQGLVDESFHTLAPQIVGPDHTNPRRRSLTGTRHWSPDTSPKLHLLSARSGIRDAGHLFLRYKVL